MLSVAAETNERRCGDHHNEATVRGLENKAIAWQNPMHLKPKRVRKVKVINQVVSEHNFSMSIDSQSQKWCVGEIDIIMVSREY